MTQDEEGRAPATIALLPCPFCGGEPKIEFWSEFGKSDVFEVKCERCELQMVGPLGGAGIEGKARAAKQWNRRHRTEAQAKLREALAEAVADFEEHASFAQVRLEDGDELGAGVWRIALTDIKQEALDNAKRLRATLRDTQP